MEITSELHPNSELSTSAEAVYEPARHEHPADPALATPSAVKAHCLWCGRIFRARATGGSAQRFCSTEHRKAFWTAARRWTMRAIEAGLLSVECLKGNQTSVHAAGSGISAGDQVSVRFTTSVRK